MRRPWFLLLPRLIGPLALIWVGIYLARQDLVSGTVVLVVGAITFVLGWRLVVGSRAATETKAGDLAKSEFDYLVWFYFGVPMILAILILIVAIANR